MQPRSPDGCAPRRATLLANAVRSPRPGLPLDEHAAEAAWNAYARGDAGASYRDALARCLQRLPPRDRAALERRYQAGGSRAAVAAALQLSDEGTKTVLRRARLRLQACVRRRLEEP